MLIICQGLTQKSESGYFLIIMSIFAIKIAKIDINKKQPFYHENSLIKGKTSMLKVYLFLRQK
jgi:hypothetical protein